MILIAVIFGYISGIAPIIAYKILENKKEKVQVENQKKEEKVSNEIFDEWLNGPKKENEINENKQVTSEDIFKEYVTGKVEKGE